MPALALLACLATLARAQPPYEIHFQTTVIGQGHPSFHARYSGSNSLRSRGEQATSLTSTLFLETHLRPGTELHFDPEVTGGRGMSDTKGIAGFPNGESTHAAGSQPQVIIARATLRQSLGARLALSIGRFALTDIFDANSYSHDPRTQFLNWSLMDSAAWDYPADALGYTYAAALQWQQSPWAARAAAAALPSEANSTSFDRRLGRAHGLVLQADHEHTVSGREGALRALVFLNEARMGSYDQALNDPRPDVKNTRVYGRTKYGFAVNAEQSLSELWGGFFRFSWNDGRNESWAFTEIDRSICAGVVRRRNGGELGLGAAVNGLSGPHRRYLAAGGSGFILGDGTLRYGEETILETYYRQSLEKHLSLTPDFQFVVNPGFNRDRGPASVLGLRLHAEF